MQDPEAGIALIKAIQELNAEIRDLSMVYEGTTEFVGGAELAGQEPAVLKRSFQANFLHRYSDSATLLDSYRREINSEYPLTRSIATYFRSMRHDASVGPHENVSSAMLKPYRSSIAALDAPESPFRFFYSWYFKWISTVASAKTESRGWEEIDGRKCVKLRTVLTSRNPQAKEMARLLWVDLERGGHPLKVEAYLGEDLDIKTDNITLVKFKPAAGPGVWLPVSGVTSTYLWNGKYYKKPVMRETYSVAASTVRINDGIPDRFFSVKNAGKGPGDGAPNPLKKDFDLEASRPSPERPAMDRASVQARLDRELREADRQSEMIAASSSSDVPAWSILSPSAVLIALGAVILFVGIRSLRRSSNR